jgi:hypothetical protein
MGLVLHLEESVCKILVVHLLICFYAALGRVCLQELLCCSWTCLCTIAPVLLFLFMLSTWEKISTHAEHKLKVLAHAQCLLNPPSAERFLSNFFTKIEYVTHA